MTTPISSSTLSWIVLGGKVNFSILDTLDLWRMETIGSFLLGEAWSRGFFHFSVGLEGFRGEDSSFWSCVIDLFMEDLISYLLCSFACMKSENCLLYFSISPSSSGASKSSPSTSLVSISFFPSKREENLIFLDFYCFLGIFLLIIF